MNFAREEDMYFDRLFSESEEEDDDEEYLSPAEIKAEKENAAYEAWKYRNEERMMGSHD
jgi:hypothetical protein